MAENYYCNVLHWFWEILWNFLRGRKICQHLSGSQKLIEFSEIPLVKNQNYTEKMNRNTKPNESRNCKQLQISWIINKI